LTQKDFYELLKRASNCATVDELFDLAKRERNKKLCDRTKIRDNLIMLSRKGCVEQENEKWKIICEFSR
jgi:hypothetical protein